MQAYRYPLHDSVLFKGRLSIGFLALLWTCLPSLVSLASFYAVLVFYRQPFYASYGAFLVVVMALCALIMQPGRSFASQLTHRRVSMTIQTVVRWAAVLFALLLIGVIARSSIQFPRRVSLTWIILNPTLIVATSFALQSWLRHLTLSIANHRRVLIAGCNETSILLSKHIKTNPALCMSVAGFFDDRCIERLGDPKVNILGDLASLADYARRHVVDIIFVALPIPHLQRVMLVLDNLRDTTASIYYVPDIFSFDLIQARTDNIEGIPVVAMCETPLHGLRGVGKRMFDIVLGSLACVMFLPVAIVIAPLIKLTSNGPVIFAQRRYGLDGCEIKVYKFRTMTLVEDGNDMDMRQATKNDQRVTSIGRILRRYSLDELPQLINVLKGQMSLVGPRPHAVAHNEVYRKLIKGYMIRHKVLPGITGLAQVMGFRGETADISQMKGRVELDLEYLRRWSIGLDLSILIRTALRMFRDPKAY
jgi:putative colanic acid biosysnthesis UDP-glucose lipid carrier transferase